MCIPEKYTEPQERISGGSRNQSKSYRTLGFIVTLKSMIEVGVLESDHLHNNETDKCTQI